MTHKIRLLRLYRIWKNGRLPLAKKMAYLHLESIVYKYLTYEPSNPIDKICHYLNELEELKNKLETEVQILKSLEPKQ